jgi:4-amino-4-deoxy-L-arabinose transferase-like glycosyltransferase
VSGLTGRLPSPLRRPVARARLLGVLALLGYGAWIWIGVYRPFLMHEDEALYAGYARHIVLTGDLWMQDLAYVGNTLKQIPLMYWATSLSLALVGDSDLATRLPGLLATVVVVAAVFELGRLSAGRLGGLAAAVIVALSPFTVLFAPTVFLDPLAVGLGAAALLAAARGRPIPAGVLVALAAGTKLLLVSYLPLVVLTVWLAAVPRSGARRAALLVAGSFGVTFGGLLGIMAFRSAFFDLPWFLSEQYRVVGGTTLLAPGEWAARASQWAGQARHLFAGPLPTAAALAAGAVTLAALRRRHRRTDVLPALSFLFGLAYLGLLVAWRTPVYDRYLLLVVPPLALAAGVGLARLARLGQTGQGRCRRPAAAAALVLAALLVVPQAYLAATDWRGLALSSRAANGTAGYNELCRTLRESATGVEVVWHRHLSWHLAFCLQDAAIYRYYFSDPGDITQEGPRMFLALDEFDDEGIPGALAARGFSLSLVARYPTGGAPGAISLHRLDGPSGR